MSKLEELIASTGSATMLLKLVISWLVSEVEPSNRSSTGSATMETVP